MRNILLFLIVWFTVVNIAEAQSFKSEKNKIKKIDSTSYLYLNHFDNNISTNFYWEKDIVLINNESQITCNNELIDSLEKILTTKSSLFSLPQNYIYTPNPTTMTFEINGTEYEVGLIIDKTSFYYQQRKKTKLSKIDTLNMFLPFKNSNLNNYNRNSLGISAWNIEIKPTEPERFHINLHDKKAEIEYPWILIIPLIISFVLILLTNFYVEGYIKRLFLIVFYHNAFINTISERNITADKAGLTLFINYIINIVVFIYISITRNNITFQIPLWILLISAFIGIFLIFQIKHIVSLLLSSLFQCKEISRQYYCNISFVLQMLGILLLPINFLMLYVGYEISLDILFKIGISFCVITELTKIFRLIRIILDKHFSIFYLFLYLCTVEILPVLLAVKIISH
ncbi:MAG: DUF4271 domain-containing protein [Bacteroidales bacterium]|nr:DUF4271 domain-containing protein [Bacteroidales bacterium]